MAKKGYRKKILSFLLAGLLVGTTVGSDLCVTVMASSTKEPGVAAPKAAQTVYIGDVGYDSLDAAVKATGEGQTVQISLKDNQVVSSTVSLKKGQKISIVPADNKNLMISRASKFTGNMFNVTAENAELTLGKAGMTGTLVLDGTPKDVAAGTLVEDTVKVTKQEAFKVLDKASVKVDLQGKPAIKGKAVIGEVLEADISGVIPANAKVSYAWMRKEGSNATPIAGATESKYTITSDDAGKTLFVQVTGIDTYTGTVTSDATDIVGKKSPDVKHDKVTAAYGQTLKDIALKSDANGTFSWIDESQPVGEVGEREFEAIYRPKDSANYDDANLNILVSVQPKKININFDKNVTMVYGGEAPKIEYKVPDSEKVNNDEVNVSFESDAFAPGAAAGKIYDLKAISSNPNYEFEVVTGKVEVTKAKTKLSMTAKTVYDNGLAIHLEVTAAPNGTGAAPTGTIVFTDSAGSILKDNKVKLENGKASFNYKVDKIQKYSLKADYVPDADSNYDGAETASIEYTPEKLAQSLAIEKVEDKTYGDDPFELKVTGASGEGKMTFSVAEGKDVVSVDEKGKVTIKAAGTATVKVTKAEDANYKSGSATVEFTVAPMKLTADDVKISGISSSYKATGKQIKPNPTIKLGDKKLKKDTDYELVYGKNTAVGTGTVEIKFKGNYTGTIKKTFKITKSTPRGGNNKKTNSNTSKAKGAKTADNTPINSAVLALLVSGTLGGAVVYRKRKAAK